jgi:hypothetical protein
VSAESRPAFYALAPGSWRDYVTLLHPPYTLWHLSYVAIGAAIAPHFDLGRLGAALAAFFLGLGVCAHALDELHGRPLQTRIPASVLWTLAAVSLAGAVAIGIVSAIAWTPWLLALVAFGGFIVCAYNLELFGGAFHSTLWFALAWGSLPALAAYVVQAETLRLEALAAAAYAALFSYAQRVLSTPARAARREAGTVRPELETALMALAAASVAVGLAVLLVHV